MFIEVILFGNLGDGEGYINEIDIWVSLNTTHLAFIYHSGLENRPDNTHLRSNPLSIRSKSNQLK